MDCRLVFRVQNLLQFVDVNDMETYESALHAYIRQQHATLYSTLTAAAEQPASPLTTELLQRVDEAIQLFNQQFVQQQE